MTSLSLSNLKSIFCFRTVFCLILISAIMICWSPSSLPMIDYSIARWLSVTYLGIICCVEVLLNGRLESGFSKWCLVLGFFFALHLFSIFYSINIGLALRSSAIVLTWLVIAIYAQKSQFQLTWLRNFLVLPATLTIAGSFAAFYWRQQWFTFDVDFMGSLLGNRNGVSIFLAATLPLFLVLNTCRKSIHFYLLTYASVFVIITNRTRSAWLMLLVYALILAIVGLKKKNLHLKKSLAHLCLAVISTILIMSLVPTSLKWNQANPYLESATSLASLDKSSGRKYIWQVTTRIMRDNLGLGIGAGQLPVAFPNYLESMPTNDKDVIKYPNRSTSFNEYLQAGAELGVIGFILILILLLGLPVASLLFLWRGKDLPTSHCENPFELVTAVLIACAIAINASVDYPLKRPELLPIYAVICGVLWSYLSADKNHIKMEQQGKLKNVLILMTASASLLFLISVTMMRGGSLYYREVATKNHSFDELWSGYKLWPWDFEWVLVLQNLELGLMDTRAEEIIRDLAIHWPTSPAPHLAAAYVAEGQNNFELSNDYYQRIFSAWHSANLIAYEYYKSFKSRVSLPPNLKSVDPKFLSPNFADDLQKLAPFKLRWGQAQSFLQNWHDLPLVSGNWHGFYQPYTLVNGKLSPVLPPAKSNTLVDYYSPTPMSDSEIILAGKLQEGPDRFDIYIYDQKIQLLKNLTNSPAHDSGDFCIHKASKNISWSEGAYQAFENEVNIRSDLSNSAKRKGSFDQCIWRSATELWGHEKKQGKSIFWTCEWQNRSISCQATDAFKDVTQFGGFFKDAKGEIGILATTRSDLFRKPYFIDNSKKSLKPHTPSRAIVGDVVEFDGQDSRIGLQSQFFLENSEDRKTVVYKFLRIKNEVFGIVAKDENPRFLARLADGKWQPALQSVDWDEKIFPAQEVWIQQRDPNKVIQSMYFGPLDPSKVVIWWHGGPKENISARYHPYFHYLNQIGFSVLAVNYPGSTGRGQNFENELSEEAFKETIEAVLNYLRENKVSTVVSWSVSAGARAQDIILGNNMPISAIIDQASSPRNPQRREAAKAKGIAYFDIHGLYDRGYDPDQTTNFVYAGGHDITSIQQFSSLAPMIKKFLNQLSKISDLKKLFVPSRLLLDAGHDGNSSDPNEADGLKEATLTYALARTLQTECLKNKNVNLTRSADVTLLNRDRSMLLRAAQKAESEAPFLSLHFNASDPSLPSANLTSVFIPRDAPKSVLKIASNLVEDIRKVGIGAKEGYPELRGKAGRLSSGVFSRQMALIKRDRKRPCQFLVEASYYDDKEESKKLKKRLLDKQGVWQYPRIQEFANAICKNIDAILSCENKS